MKSKNDEITIKSLAEIFIPKIWIILLVSFILGAALAGYSQFIQKDKYTSTGKFNINKIPFSNAESENTGLNSGEIEAMQGMIANMKEIINTLDFCEAVVEKINSGEYNDEVDYDYQLPISIAPKELLGMITVTLSGSETTCYYIDVTCGDAKLSHLIALAAGDHLCEVFMNMKYAIEITRIGTPRLPSAPDSKNVVRNTIIGFAAGLVVSMVVVFLLSKFDVIIRSREKIEENFDYPILGVIPKMEAGQ